jgi:D-aspartate ligase
MGMRDGPRTRRPAGWAAQVDTSTPAVVLKLDPNVMHHGGLGVIRSLGRLGVPVYGVQEGPLAPAASSRYLSGRYFWSPGPDDHDRITAGLTALASRIGRPAVLLPTDDAGAIFLAEHGAQLRSSYLFPDQPAGLPRQVAGKFSLFELCRDLGVPAVAAVAVDSSADSRRADSRSAAREFAAQAGYPLIAKLTAPWEGGEPAGHAPLRSTTILRAQADLDDALAATQRAGTGLMLQEFIPAGPGDDWFFHGYCDAASDCRPAFTGVKERSYPAHAGLTSLGRSEPNPALRDQITGLLSKIGYRGLLDMDLRRDRRDGEYKLLDFNPRLGAQFRLFATTAGVDLAAAAYLDLTGQPIPAGEQAGRRFLVESYDPLGALAYWRRGELSPAAWLASLRGVSELAWFARDDLAPFGLMSLRMGWRLAAPAARALAGPIAPRRHPAAAPPEGRFSAGRAARRGRAPSQSDSAQPITRSSRPRTAKEGAQA